MKLSFTPGPWSVSSGDMVRIYASKKRTVAGVHRQGLHTGQCDPAEVMANARLIAAAPDMAKYIRSNALAGCAKARKLLEQINADR